MLDLNCAIIGDVNLDVICDLSKVSLSHLDNSCINGEIKASIGGNGIFFAEAARDAGFKTVTLMCALGEDEAGSEAKIYCTKKEVEVVDYGSGRQTGKVIILYQADDKRIMIADRGANEDFLMPPERLPVGLTNTTRLLYISGYSMLEESQRQSVTALAHEFRKAGAFVLLDAVPHDVYQYFSWEEYVSLCNFADGIALEAVTLATFLKEDSGGLFPHRAADILLKIFEFCIVRINSVSDFLLADRRHRIITTIPYNREIASLRFTDNVIAHVLYRYFWNPIDLFRTENWMNPANIFTGRRQG